MKSPQLSAKYLALLFGFVFATWSAHGKTSPSVAEDAAAKYDLLDEHESKLRAEKLHKFVLKMLAMPAKKRPCAMDVISDPQIAARVTKILKGGTMVEHEASMHKASNMFYTSAAIRIASDHDFGVALSMKEAGVKCVWVRINPIITD